MNKLILTCFMAFAYFSVLAQWNLNGTILSTKSKVYFDDSGSPNSIYSNVFYGMVGAGNYRSGQVMESSASINFGLTGPLANGFVFRWLSSNGTPIDYLTNDYELMRLTKAGRLGLGVDPISTLHVYTPLAQTSVSGVTIDVQNFGSYAATSDFLKIRNVGAGSTPFIIKGTGNVGINTANPDATLAVKGDIHAKEVRVDVNVPPDYVFETDYRLLNLSEVRQFIQQNSHLPEVPSAAEMEQNGVKIGEMNMLLLKKVEELTLYIIQQQDELKKQQQQIEALQAKIK